MRLILVEVATPTKYDDGGVSVRHVFMTQEGKEQVMFCPDDDYRSDVTPALKWDDSKAHNFLVEERAPWQGKEKLPKLISKKEALAFLKACGEKF